VSDVRPRLALALLRRREAQAQTISSLIGSLFPAQSTLVRAILSGQRRTALVCARRAGKSWALAVLLCVICLRRSGARCMWLGLTQRNIKRFAWDIIGKLNIRFGLGAVPNLSTLTWVFPNGSTIEIDGADNVRESAEKYTGAAFDCVIVDECGSFGADLLEYIWSSVFRPTLIDRRGCAILAGSPRHILTGLFHDGSRGLLADWTPATWSSLDNLHVADNIRSEISEMLSANPLVCETTAYRREILGEWCPEQSAFVYDIRQAISHEPHVPLADTRWIIGLDPGHRDAAGFVVIAHSRSARTIRAVHSESHTELTTAQISGVLRGLQTAYSGSTVVVDAEAAGMIADLRKTYRIQRVVGAKKTRKLDAIRALNGELSGVAWDVGSRRVYLHAAECESLIREASQLAWREMGGERAEDPTCDNHCCDAFLYAWRYASRWGTAPTEQPESYSERTVRELTARARRESSGDSMM